jgi:hypothetical protein
VNRSFASGLVLTVVGVVGYLVGIDVSYPGRAFSLTALMVGITLLALTAGEGG